MNDDEPRLEPALPGRRLPSGAPTIRAGELVAGRFEVRRLLRATATFELYEAYDRLLEDPILLRTVPRRALGEGAFESLLAEVRRARSEPHAEGWRVFEVGLHERPAGSPEPRQIPFMTGMPLPPDPPAEARRWRRVEAAGADGGARGR